MTSLMMDLFIKSYNLMGYDSFTPGEIDLSWGVAGLKEIGKTARFSFLLSNLLDKKTKEPVFAPFLIKNVGGTKVGLLGLISNRFSLSKPLGDREKFQIAEPLEAATKGIADLKYRGCQVIMVVAHLEDDEQRRLSEAFPEVDLIVSGHVGPFAPQPIRSKNAEILRAGTRGEYLGQMDFSLNEKKKEKKLSPHFRLIPLHEGYGDHDQTAKLVKEFKLQMVAAMKEPASGSRVPAPAQISPAFAGMEACLFCHPKQHASWEKTGHARAFQTLVRDKRSSDPTCLPCHTTGFGEKVDSGGILPNVQCESCHGPRKGHPENQTEAFPVGEDNCISCHNPAKSPNFEYGSYLAKVRCTPAR